MQISPVKQDLKKPLQQMFDQVPKHYDLLNRLLTFGFDQRWRKLAAHYSLQTNPKIILDLCCGTGDLTIHLAKLAATKTTIKALDYSKPMLSKAKEKANYLNLSLEFIEASAADLPFPDNAYDSIGIAFAFRNVTWKHPQTHAILSEIIRVLKPKGHFVIIETSQPMNTILRIMFHLYLKWIARPVGTLLSGHKTAYAYLATSAINYYDANQVSDLLNKAGFRIMTAKLLLGGIAALHIVEKP